MLPIPSRTLVVLAGAAGALLAIHLVLKAEREKGRAQCMAEHAQAAAEALARTRAQEFRIQAQQQRSADATRQDIDRNRRDADAAGVAGDGLRIAAADRFRLRGADDPASAPGVAATAAERDLLADMLRTAQDRLRGLAAEADARRAAGLGCEREHDAVSGR